MSLFYIISQNVVVINRRSFDKTQLKIINGTSVLETLMFVKYFFRKELVIAVD